jgi:Tfp pilus assembly protein PilV
VDRGFSIVETIVALALIVTGVVALAGVASRATHTVVRARQRAVGVHLADAALTELAARGVAPSSPGCLLGDVAGCVEYRDADGQVATGPAAAYAVRWYAAAVPSSPLPATILTVCAVAAAERAAAARAAGACATRVLMAAWP